MWFVELRNVREAIWAVCKEQGLGTLDRCTVMRKQENRGIQNPLYLGIGAPALISALWGTVSYFQGPWEADGEAALTH